MLDNARLVLAVGRSRHVVRTLAGSLLLGLCAGAASVGLLALSGWFIAMSALAGAGLAAGFSFFYPSAGVQALAFGRTALRYLERLVGHGATLRLDAALKESVFATAIEGEAGSSTTTGIILHAVTSDAEVAEASLLRVIAPVVTYVGVSVGGCCLIATVSLTLAAVVAVGSLALALAVIIPAWASSIAPGRRLADAEMAARQEITDALDGMDELLSFGAESLGALRVDHALGAVHVAQVRLRLLALVAKAIGIAVIGLTVLLVAAVASGALGHHSVAVASAAAITLAALGMLQLSDPVAAAAQEFGRTRAVWRRLGELLSDASMDPSPRANEYDLPGTIRVDHVTVDRGRGVIIDDLNLRATPGQTVLLTGRSGAGKTSLLATLSGQIPHQSGHVHLAGTVVRLPQHPYVFRGTVSENLRLANPEASLERMQEVLVMVGLDDILGPSALDRGIGSGGRALSGGQMRRLSIAQSLLAQPDVLLADEPTEGLDISAARELLLAVRLSNPWLTLILALHDQQINQLSWVPDTVVQLAPRAYAVDSTMGRPLRGGTPNE
jgi:ATP-binding cassette, subfamily C, bacterial CydC